MGLILKPTPISVLPYTLIFLLCFGVLVSKTANSISDYNTLVFKDCAAQTFTASSGDSHSQTLPSLFQELVTHSSQSKFFKTTAGDAQLGISGLFQCKGDLSNSECYSCVNTLYEISNSLCSNAVGARIQLLGCYVFYETDGFSNPRENELVYKTCDKSEAVVGSGFVDSRDTAFAALESGVVSSDIGFYAESYEFVHVMGQCEGDLGNCDCVECVSNAVQISKEECGGSISVQIYLDKCFISYTYYPKGIPDDTNSEKKNRDSRGKAIAIVVGGAAALCFGFVFLLFIKSWGKKDDDW